MKAVRIHAYGNADVLAYEDAPMPQIAADDVLVRVVNASVNPVDWKIREGHAKSMLSYTFPLILGWDVSGVVEAIGENVTRFKVGDAVFSRPDIKRDGTYAEYVAIRETELAHKPKTVSHAEAASLPLAGITAWEVLITTARITSRQRVLIHAGAGGVGSLAIQLAKTRGAYVIATASGKNVSLVRSLGADEVIDYRAQAFEKVVKDVDVVFDTLGGQVQDVSWNVLKPGGILVSIVSPPSEERAKELGMRAGFVFIEPSAPILTQLAALVDAGAIRPIVGAEYALKDIAKAHAFSQSGRAVGKIVLYVGQP
ncbi:NADP-dependent oxidoreductase [uncultured Oxalicibacterium sp.]|uniref:NADP-dependent oxidoreductase n=1 Tax=uncultured Oxalicibacterium sp. TaxID=1168540 RepID=UPI0025F57067|nr:NADP-dependent oxidoreductase [uncultured Oxalicibacterium sp.]